MHRFESQVNMLLNGLAGQVRDARTIYVRIYWNSSYEIQINQIKLTIHSSKIGSGATRSEKLCFTKLNIESNPSWLKLVPGQQIH